MAELNLFRDLVKFSLKDKTKLGQTAKAVTDTYKDAQRFILPRNGIILDNEGDALEGDLRLPFPMIVLEFESDVSPDKDINITDQLENMSFISNVYDRHIVFARETERGELEIQLASKFTHYEGMHGQWNTAPFKMIFPWTLVNKGVDAKIIPTHKAAFEWGKVIGGSEAATLGIGALFLKPAFKAVAELLEALACSNVVAELKPNQKRLKGRRPGELPYDDYHELVVHVSGVKSVNLNDPSEEGITKRREHLRRGHIRRYKTGLKVWVQAHVVNAGSAGKVTKHYKVK